MNLTKQNINKKRFISNALMTIFSALIAVSLYAFVIDDANNAQKNESGTYTHSTKNLHKMAGFSALPGDTAVSSFVYAAESCVDGVVHITTTKEVQTYSNPLYRFFYGPSVPQNKVISGIGSGVMISSDGYILTNNHVIENTDNIEITLNNNQKYQAEMVGSDPTTDLAVVKIDAENLPYIPYGDSDELRIGQWVLAIGNPFNLTSTVTAGIVSAKSRSLGINDERYSIESFIQTDAALNKGNSGGALINLKGELVGINTAILSPSGAYAGESFAIPVNIAQKVAKDLIEYGKVQRAILGVTIRTLNSELAEQENMDEIKGVYIEDLMENGAAKEAGLKKGDVITEINDVEVNTAANIQEEISKYRPGDEVTVTIFRDGKKKHFDVVLKNLYGTTKIVKAKEQISVLGAEFKNLSPAKLKKLGIKYGVQVTDLDNGKFKEAGIKEGFVIAKINNQPVKDVSELKEMIGGINGGVYIEGIYPNGVRAYYAFGIK
jgi:Do/DeqQ family serine protease